MKKLIIVLLCFALFFCSCKKNEISPETIPKETTEKEEFIEPSDDWVPFEGYPTETNGYYTFFKDFAVDFPGGWYKSLNRLVQQDSPNFRYIEVLDSIPFENAEKAFKKLDKEYSLSLHSEEMTFGGYPAKKYITLNPEGTEKYKKYFYDYYIFLEDKAAHLRYSPGRTESSKNEREYIEKYLDSIIKLTVDYPESLYDMSPENFLSGKNDRYIEFLFTNVISALNWQSITDVPLSEYKGFSSASELSSSVLLNVYFSAADGHYDMYETENINTFIPKEDIYHVLDKYFIGYSLDLSDTFLDIEFADGGKTAVVPGFIGISTTHWGGSELESVSDNGGGSLCVKYLLSGTEGGKTVRYSLVIRPSENRCVIEKLEIEHFE